MPNGTDVTEYLTLGMDASNLALTGHYAHYHTRDDRIENLSESAVFHIGVSALSAVEGFMGVDPDAAETNKIYGDVLGLFILSLPQSWGLPLIILTLIASAVALFRTERKAAPLWRVLLMPLIILIGGTALAFIANLGVNAIRSESAYGQAYPIALRGLFLSLGLLVAVLTARWLYRPDGACRYLVGSWAVLMALGIAATLSFPGAVVLFALPAILILPASLLLIVRQALGAKILYGLGAFIALTQLLSLHVGAETALFVETSAPLTALMLWIFLISLPLFWTREGPVRRPLIGTGIAVMGFGLAALIVPAYSAQSPLGANLYHVADAGEEDAHLVMSGRNPLPDSLREMGGFTKGDLDGFTRNAWIAPLAAPDLTPPTMTIIENRMDGEERHLTIQISAPDANRLELSAENEGLQLSAFQINGFALSELGGSIPSIECNGRACRALILDMQLADHAGPVELDLWAIRWGMGPEGQPFDQARPDWMGPQHDGDRRILRQTFSIPEPALSEPVVEE